MDTPHAEELLRRIRLDDVGATLDVSDRGGFRLTWRRGGIDHPLVLAGREEDLAAAVTEIGEDCRDALWPDSSVEEAGFNLLLVHVDEVVDTRDTSRPLFIGRHGLDWPDELLPS